jgi:hypothetical protein
MAYVHRESKAFLADADDRLRKSLGAVDPAAIDEFVAFVDEIARDYEKRYIFSASQLGWQAQL